MKAKLVKVLRPSNEEISLVAMKFLIEIVHCFEMLWVEMSELNERMISARFKIKRLFSSGDSKNNKKPRVERR